MWDTCSIRGIDVHRPRSITFRLTALYSVTTIVVLAVSGMTLYWFLMHSFEVEDSHFLVAKVHELRTDFQEGGNRTDRLVREIRTETGSVRFREYYARLLNAGHVVGETPGMASRLPYKLFPAGQSYRIFSTHLYEIEISRGRAYRLAAVILGRDAASGQQVTLQLAVDVSRDRAVLADYRDTLLFVLTLGTLFATALGVWAARRGLAPLRAMTRVVGETSAEQLDRRIVDAGRWPRELSGLAEAFDAMLERLAGAFHRMRQFSADVAHELRTPLNNLRGEAEVVLSRSRGADAYRRVIESMHEEELRLERIVESLLFLARAEQGREPLAHKILELASSVGVVIEYYRSLAEEQGITLRSSGAAQVTADPDLIQRALGNLISNAIRYTPSGGSITVVIERLRSGGAEVRVTDTGFGIPAAHLPRLFDRFYRVDAARSGAAQGSGLGLSIVRSIMTLHGGSVALASTLGSGTTVILIFPATSPA